MRSPKRSDDTRRASELVVAKAVDTVKRPVEATKVRHPAPVILVVQATKVASFLGSRDFPSGGFSNAAFTKRYHVINLKMLEERFEDGAEITLEVLAAQRLVRDVNLPLKVLGEGDLTKKFSVTATKFSASARKKIEDAGGENHRGTRQQVQVSQGLSRHP